MTTPLDPSVYALMAVSQSAMKIAETIKAFNSTCASIGQGYCEVDATIKQLEDQLRNQRLRGITGPVLPLENTVTYVTGPVGYLTALLALHVQLGQKIVSERSIT